VYIKLRIYNTNGYARRGTINSCFGAALHTTKKDLFISGRQRLQLKRRLYRLN
jgi:hypothetical protein